MDKCSLDVTVEFLCVAFHAILYYTSLYPKSIFETRRKYGVVVYYAIHPDINKYLDLCLKNIAELLTAGKLDRIEFVIRDGSSSVMKFVFDFGTSVVEKTKDEYLVKCEQDLRAFCLTLASSSGRFKAVSNDSTFSILLHTDESSAVSLASNPDLQEFPFIEVDGTSEGTTNIIPLRRFSVRGNQIECYIET